MTGVQTCALPIYFTTTLPGYIDPSVFASLPAPGGALSTPVPTPVVPAPQQVTTPTNGPPVVDAGDDPSEPVFPLPELIDSDADDDIDVPDTVQAIRRDVLRTLERRRKLAALTPPPYSGGGVKRIDYSIFTAQRMRTLARTKKTIPAMSSMVMKKPGHCTRTYHKKNF